MRLVMMGTGRFAEPTFEKLIAGPHDVLGLVTQPDRQTGRARGSTRQAEHSMKVIAERHGIPVFQPETINSAEGVELLKRCDADLLVVAAYGQILSNDVLGTTKHGGINVHASLLPKYRGAAPIAWAIYDGEEETGVTIIQMSIYLDAGAMLAQEKITIKPDETAGELEARLAPLGAVIAARVVDEIANGSAAPIKQEKSRVTKAPKLQKSHGVVNWYRTAEQIRNQIRAMHPWPTPYTFLNRPDQPAKRVILFPVRVAKPDEAGVESLESGELAVDPETHKRLFVGTGSNELVEVLEIQPAGKRRMTAQEFLLGHPITNGAHFAPEMP